MSKRLSAMGQKNYLNGFRVTMHEHVLDTPLGWTRPQTIFVDSMGDLFHEEVTVDFIVKVFDTMLRTPWHTYQVLTKRSGRLSEFVPKTGWPPNVWVGVSVEDMSYTSRIDDLRDVPARIRFVSFEPLLGDVGDVNLAGIHWVIVGGESGPGARQMRREWAVAIRDQCIAADVPFFFKQWGGTRRRRAGRLLEGHTWDQLPAMANVR